MVARATALREQLYEEADAAEERGGYSPELHRAFPEAWLLVSAGDVPFGPVLHQP